MALVELRSPTGRLRLASPTAADDAAVLQNRTHPDTRKYLNFLPERLTMDEARRLRENRAKDSTTVDLIIHLGTNQEMETFAGSTGCFQLDETFKSCEICIFVAPHLQRCGIATEALYTVLKWTFEEKKLHRVTFETAKDNLPMRHWLEDVAGAKLEAARRECWRNIDGTYTDVREYSILEWEWVGSVKSKLEMKLGMLD